MADAASSANATANRVTQRPRRASSLRKSSNDFGLPPGYLDALEVKRRALDESIHKFIAAKEREYKLYEKELKHQAKREESLAQRSSCADTTTPVDAQAARLGATAAAAAAAAAATTANGDQQDVDYHESIAGDHRRHDSQGSLTDATDVEPQESRLRQPSQPPQREEFSGVFTPEYLALLSGDGGRHTSAALSEAPGTEIVQMLGSSRQGPNTAATALDVPHPMRIVLGHRTSSSGSSVDGKLVSAMKSMSDTAQSKRKRVSIAVGDAIVAPSDSVPVSLHVNSSSSHSRMKATRRDAPAAAKGAAEQNSLGILVARYEPVTNNHAPLQPARDSTEPHTAQTQDDIGDLFDLEDSDMLEPHNSSTTAQSNDNEVESSQESLNEDIGCNPEDLGASADDDRRTDSGPLPHTNDEEELQDVPLTPIIGASAAAQPADPGFRRPSVLSDPVYRGAHSRPPADDRIYSSSFSRPTSKGSFTSGSLGESYMAKNAEAMMESRMQQQHQHERRHRPSHNGTALPVR